MIWISYFILASLLTCYLKVGGSVLNVEPSFGLDLHYAATLHVDEFVVTSKTKNASRDISCTFGQHFISEMKILPQDSDFARMEQAIKSKSHSRVDYFSDIHCGENFRGGPTFLSGDWNGRG